MDVSIIGTGIHPFGRHEHKSGPELGEYAVREALANAGIAWKDIQCTFGGSWQEGTIDSLIARLGPTGAQYTSVLNNCATAGSALHSAAAAIEAGYCDVALAVGYDKHPRGAFTMDPALLGLEPWYGEIGFMTSVQFFAMKTQRYMHDFGITNDSLTRVAVKNFRNGSLAPHAWRREATDYDTVANSMLLCNPLRKYMFCSPCEGGAAAVLCRTGIAKQFTRKPVVVKGLSIRTRNFGSLEVCQPANPLDEVDTPVEMASEAAFEMAGIGPKEVQVAQLQDSESGSEIMHMAETGLCEHGAQEQMLKAGETEITGRLPINTDGGLIANGEPVGASGLRQIYEICAQLKGEAGERQVPGNPKVGLTQVYGAPGVSAVVILQR
jgi:acetyl-CoA C-acetyltransferase